MVNSVEKIAQSAAWKPNELPGEHSPALVADAAIAAEAVVDAFDVGNEKINGEAAANEGAASEGANSEASTLDRDLSWLAMEACSSSESLTDRAQVSIVGLLLIGLMACFAIGVGAWSSNNNSSISAEPDVPINNATDEDSLNALLLQIDLNKASVAELELLPSVGKGLAKRIVETRNQLGGFRSMEELQTVPGIGPKRFEEFRHILFIEESTEVSDVLHQQSVDSEPDEDNTSTADGNTAVSAVEQVDSKSRVD